MTEILAEVAGRHPLVLPSPGPVAVLEDFGADAMSFVVDFWVEVRPGVEPRLVASELRHQIVEALGAAGIVMPSAQREVQLDTVRPLAVQVVPAPGSCRVSNARGDRRRAGDVRGSAAAAAGVQPRAPRSADVH